MEVIQQIKLLIESRVGEEEKQKNTICNEELFTIIGTAECSEYSEGSNREV